MAIAFQISQQLAVDVNAIFTTNGRLWRPDKTPVRKTPKHNASQITGLLK